MLAFQIAYGVFSALTCFAWITWQIYLDHAGQSTMRFFSLIAEESLITNFAVIVLALAVIYWAIIIPTALLSGLFRKLFP